MRGQALIFEAAILLVLAVVTFILAQHLFKVQYLAEDYALRLNAQRILINWTDTGIIYAIAYGYGGSGDPQLAKAAVETLLPPNFGYNLTVTDVYGNVVFTVANTFDPARASGASMILLRREPRIVTLRLSR